MNYIGIDLGGTNIKGALVSAEGEILKEHSIPTRVDLGPEAVAGRIGQVIAQLSIGEDTVGGVGVGCPGTVDDASGIVRFAAFMPPAERLKMSCTMAAASGSGSILPSALLR